MDAIDRRNSVGDDAVAKEHVLRDWETVSVGKRKAVSRAGPNVQRHRDVGGRGSAAAFPELDVQRHALTASQNDDANLVTRLVRVQRIRVLE